MIGLGAAGYSNRCEIAFGEARTGKATQVIDMGWATNAVNPTRRTFKLPAGVWDLYEIICGTEGLAYPIGPQGYSRTGTTFQTLARFRAGAGSVIYLGDIITLPDSGFTSARLHVNAQQARAEFTRQGQGLAENMVVRPLFRNPKQPQAPKTTIPKS